MGANSYVCRSYRRKTVRGPSCPPPSSLNRVNAKLAQANLIKKTDFDGKLSILNRKITKNKPKRLLVQNKSEKLITFDLSYFIVKSHFEEDVAQNYLVFQPMYIYFKMIAGIGDGSYIYYWKSNGLSDEKMNSNKTSTHIITPNHYKVIMVLKQE